MSEEKKNIVYSMNVDQLMEFYLRCDILNANTKEERDAILMDMMTKKRLTNAFITGRSQEQVLKDMSKHSKIGVFDKDLKEIKLYEDKDDDKKTT